MSTSAPLHCSLPYWRKSKLNGYRCVPILMRLEAGRLVAHDRAGKVIFDVPAATTRGRLTRFGTLVLAVKGHTFELVGRGSSVSPAPTMAQLQSVKEFWATHTNEVSGGPSTLDALFNGAAVWHMRTWREALVAAGATVG